MKKLNIRTLCFMAMIALLMSACSTADDTASDVTADGKRPYYFSFNTGGMSTTPTRGLPEAALSKHVGVSSFLYAKNANPGKPNFMWNEEVARSAAEGNKWRTRNAFSQPATGHNMKFMAYYPYHEQTQEEQVLTLSDDNTTGPTVITYEVPADVKDQEDIMSGESDVIDTDVETNSLSITMKHRLAGIQFVTGDIGLAGSIESITLKGIYKKGTYTLGASNWTLVGSPDDVEFTIKPMYEVQVNEDGVTLADEEGGKQVIAPEDSTLLILPQQIPVDAKLVIKFRARAKGEEEIRLHTLEAPLRSNALTEWEWGKIYRYKISVISLALEYDLETHDWEGGTDQSVVQGKIVI